MTHEITIQLQNGFVPHCAIAMGAQIHLFIVNGWTFLLLSFKSIQNCILVCTYWYIVNTQLPIFFYTDRYGNKFLCKCYALYSLGWNWWRILFFCFWVLRVISSIFMWFMVSHEPWWVHENKKKTNLILPY